MFQRNKQRETGADPAEDVDVVPGNKGRPTPTRKEAEAARKARLKPPTNRKEAAKADRRQRYDQRVKAREAMQTGDERYLPARDKGPVRKLVRDVVDSRYNVAEFLLPILVAILLVSMVRTPWAVQAVYLIWMITIFGSVADSLILVRRVRRETRARFPDENTKGNTFYAILRSTQLRRFRLPKPQIKRGAAY